jgi:hypothetical protein
MSICGRSVLLVTATGVIRNCSPRPVWSTRASEIDADFVTLEACSVCEQLTTITVARRSPLPGAFKLRTFRDGPFSSVCIPHTEFCRRPCSAVVVLKGVGLEKAECRVPASSLLVFGDWSPRLVRIEAFRVLELVEGFRPKVFLVTAPSWLTMKVLSPLPVGN